MKQHPASVKRRYILFCSAAACLLLAAVVLFDALRPPQEGLAAADFLMGTVVEVQLAGRQEDAQAVFDRIRSCENDQISRRRAGSEIARLNQNSSAALSPDVAAWLSELMDIQEASSGAFSLSLGTLSDLWNFDFFPSLPSQGEIDTRLEAIQNGGLTLQGEFAAVSDGVILDLGAAGKGIACDLAKETLLARGVTSGVVSVGGSLLLLGEKERTIAIRDPFGDAGDSFATLRLSNCFVSTSGSYEKYFEQDGVRYHHILDPKTGYPADAGLSSVTVVCGEGLLSDALSTACFVLGIEQSRPVLRQYGAEAVFVGTDGAVTVTEGLLGRYERLADPGAGGLSKQ